MDKIIGPSPGGNPDNQFSSKKAALTIFIFTSLTTTTTKKPVTQDFRGVPSIELSVNILAMTFLALLLSWNLIFKVYRNEYSY